MITSLNKIHIKKPSEIKSLYYLVSLVSFSEGLISIFVPIFLLRSNYQIYQIILFYLLSAFYFVLSAFLIKRLLHLFSDKLFLTISLPFLFLYYILLPQIPNFPLLFWIVPALGSLYSLFFNIGYHLDFCSTSKDEHSGANVGNQYAILSFVSLISPFLGGLIIQQLGFKNVFIVSAFIVLIAVLPTWFYSRRKISSSNKIQFSKYWLNKKLLPINLSSIGYSIESSISRIIWPLFIISLIKGVEILGLFTSLGLLTGGLISILVGKITDKNMGKKFVIGGSMANSVIWILRTVVTMPYLLLISQPIKDIFYGTMTIPWMTVYYKVAHREDNPGAYIMSNEVLYNVARSIILPIFLLFSVILSPNNFYTLSFISAGIFSACFMFANKQKL